MVPHGGRDHGRSGFSTPHSAQLTKIIYYSPSSDQIFEPPPLSRSFSADEIVAPRHMMQGIIL